jgi:hypothetical protein
VTEPWTIVAAIGVWAGAIATAIYALLVLRSLGAMRAQRQTMIGQLDEMRTQRQVMIDQLDEAARYRLAEARPVVIPSSADLPPEGPLRVKISNVGKGPAIDVRLTFGGDYTTSAYADSLAAGESKSVAFNGITRRYNYRGAKLKTYYRDIYGRPLESRNVLEHDEYAPPGSELLKLMPTELIEPTPPEDTPSSQPSQRRPFWALWRRGG